MSVTSDYWRLVILCCLISLAVDFQYAYSSTYTNSAVNSFKQYINDSYVRRGEVMSDSNYSTLWNLLVNIWFVGFLIGIWISRFLTDHLGRKTAFLIGNAVNICGSIVVCASIPFHQPYVLMAGRLVSSIATSISYCALVIFLQEIPPTRKKGIMSSMNGMIFAMIAMVGITLGNDHLLGHHLQYYLGIPIIPCVISFFGMFFVPETPKYLVLKGKTNLALKSIQYYHGKSADAEEALKTIEREVATILASGKVSVLDLIRVKHLRAALWLSLASLQNTVALWTILLSSTYYLEQTGLDHSIAQYSSIVMSTAYFLGAITVLFTIGKFGRRTLLLWSTTVNVASLALYVVFAELGKELHFLKYGCLVMLTIFGYSYGSGVGPVARFLGPELVPMQYKSILLAVMLSENTIVSVCFSFACRPLFNAIDAFAFLILYVIPSTIATLYLFAYLPETKGRETAEVVNILQNSKFTKINAANLKYASEKKTKKDNPDPISHIKFSHDADQSRRSSIYPLPTTC